MHRLDFPLFQYLWLFIGCIFHCDWGVIAPKESEMYLNKTHRDSDKHLVMFHGHLENCGFRSLLSSSPVITSPLPLMMSPFTLPASFLSLPDPFPSFLNIFTLVCSLSPVSHLLIFPSSQSILLFLSRFSSSLPFVCVCVCMCVCVREESYPYRLWCGLPNQAWLL